MNLNYVPVESTVKPEALFYGITTVYMRKDIVQTERTDEQNGTTVIWTYQEAALSHDEFNNYIKHVQARNALNGVNDSSNINNLLASQEMTNEQTLTVMSAIADLYELLLG